MIERVSNLSNCCSHATSIAAFCQSVYRHRQLILEMTKREVATKYKGSVFGHAWSLIQPVIMLSVYTFVFSVVFQARWSAADESKGQFAIVLFVGLTVHSLFSEVLNAAPGLILSNVNYVKKVVFPLEILPIICVGVALFHTVVRLGVFVCAFLMLNGYLHWTIVLIPVVLAPLVLLSLGCAWILASTGVFLRDVGQFVGLLTAMLLFLAPVFYPVTALPEEFRPWLLANPLTLIIGQARDVLIWGQLPDLMSLTLSALISGSVGWLGFAWFQKTRKGFADVL